MCGCLSRAPTGDLARNPSMSPDWESNYRPFDSQAGTQSTEPQHLGLQLTLKCFSKITSIQDGGIGRYPFLPHTTKRRTITNLKIKKKTARAASKSNCVEV